MSQSLTSRQPRSGYFGDRFRIWLWAAIAALKIQKVSLEHFNNGKIC
ncbi:MAG TPA: hypothetical protein VK211_28970 [Kamptonema sp.]|nr:hypothetical protein [Kamptonema sp.]